MAAISPSLLIAGTDKGELYLAGMGPGDPELATVRAMKVLEEADVVICNTGVKKRFSSYLQQKHLIMPEEGVQVWQGYGKKEADFKGKELEMWKAAKAERTRIINRTEHALKQGKIVAFLAGGDPFIYGPWGWVMEEFQAWDPEVVPGMSSFNAANAALERGPTSGKHTKSVIITMPDMPYMDNRESIENLARHRATMVIFMPTVGGYTLADHVKTLSRHYPADTPIALVCHAGFEDREELVEGTLKNIVEKVEDQDQTFLHLIYVGDFLKHENKVTR
ncbi:MAG: SAM-dependent methyltransferase [bacterium]